jgi:hypothetical protein
MSYIGSGRTLHLGPGARDLLGPASQRKLKFVGLSPDFGLS